MSTSMSIIMRMAAVEAAAAMTMTAAGMAILTALILTV